MSVDRFKLEEAIMDCWTVTRTLEQIVETASPPEEMADKIKALASIWDMKFSMLFEIFEQMIKERKVQ